MIAHCAGATGEGVAPTVGPRRTAADLAGPIAHTIATDPEAPGLLSGDPRTRHTSEALVRLVAEACGLQEERGAKEQRGRWPSMPTRAACLRDVSHRLRFV